LISDNLDLMPPAAPPRAAAPRLAPPRHGVTPPLVANAESVRTARTETFVFR